MKKKYFTFILIFLFCFIGSSCTIYTEKRSEALSQAVFATSEGIKNARFEKAFEYAEQAKKLAYPPKNPIKIPPILTKKIKSISSVNTNNDIKTSPGNSSRTDKLVSNIITSTSYKDEEETILRLVIPENLKHAKLLVENSEEWKELLQTKEFKEQLEKDNLRLKQLAQDIDDELLKQQKYNTKMIEDLNKLQKETIKKDLHILKLYIVIAFLCLMIGGGVYLRMKGVL
jgi:hypothetical protein